MSELWGYDWGPRPLPSFLTDQLAAHGFAAGDAHRCAELLREQTGSASSASLFVDLGGLNLLDGDIDGAVASWRHAIGTPHDAAAARALLNLGLLYEHLHLHDRAIGVLASVGERDVFPYAASAAMAKARCQRETGALDDAMETMARLAQRTMADHPDSNELAETLYGLGDVAHQAGRLDRAERAWRVASAGPVSAAQRSASDRLIELLLVQGHDDELVDLLDRETNESLDAHAGALLDRVEAIHVLGDEDQAVALVRRLGGPNMAVNDRFRLAEVRLQLGLVNEAIDELEVLLADTETDAHHRAGFSLGEIYRSYQMSDAATAMYERVVDDGDRYWSPKAALALGDLLSETGDAAGAVIQWHVAAEGSIAVVRDAAEQRLDAPQSDEISAAALSISAHEVDASLDPAPALKKSAAQDSPVVVPQTADDEGAIASELAHDALVGEGPAHQGSGGSHASNLEPIEISLVDDPIEIPLADEFTGPDRVVEVPSLVLPSNTPEPTGAAVVVVLDELEAAQDGAVDQPEGHAAAEEPADVEIVPQSTASVFARTVQSNDVVANPYAALAPEGLEGLEGEAAPTTRNPYAELAPNYDDEFMPSSDVEAGDWESMLDDWPKHDPVDDKPKQSSAFSKYT